MGNNSHHAFRFAGHRGAGLEGRTEATFVLGDGALNVPASPVDPRGKPVVHLPTIACLGSGISGSPRVYGNHGGLHAQGFATETMVSFRIVGPVGEEAMDRQVLRGLGDGGHKVGRVIARPVTHLQRGDQVRAVMGHQRHLRVTPVPFHAARAFEKVAADMMTLYTSRINGDFGAFFDQAALLGNPENGPEESLKSPFFRSRWWAF